MKVRARLRERQNDTESEKILHSQPGRNRYREILEQHFERCLTEKAKREIDLKKKRESQREREKKKRDRNR